MVTYIIYHNSCSEGVIKFVWPELHAHKPPLQDDIFMVILFYYTGQTAQLICAQEKKLQKLVSV